MRLDIFVRGLRCRPVSVVQALSAVVVLALAGWVIFPWVAPPSEPAAVLPMTQFVWRDDGLVGIGRSAEVHSLVKQRILVVRPGKPQDGKSSHSTSALAQAGITLGPDAHVNITAPFVILTRGAESVMLTRHTERRVTADRKLPAWVEHRAGPATFVAQFGSRGRVVVDGRSVRVHRGFTPDRSI